MEKMNGQTVDVEKANIEKLKELFPEIVADGKVDFAMLKNLLGGEIDESNEKYSFTWNGKSATIKNTLKPTTGTLIPCKDKSVDWDTTENLYIEGDNLEVLKILQKTYSKKIKMIYIDPPYNTGKDFVYKDNFEDSIANYKEITGQQQRANPNTNGRFHTDWLNMMYARLMLAKNLLSDDGAIFISIDDNEQGNLKKICDEIFGEGNFVATLAVENNPKGRKNGKFFAINHESCIVYVKNYNACSGFFDIVPKEKMLQDANGYYSPGQRVIVGKCSNKIVTDTSSDKHYFTYYKRSFPLEIRKSIDCSLSTYKLYCSKNEEGQMIENTYTFDKLLELYNNNNLVFNEDTIYEKDRNVNKQQKTLINSSKYYDLKTESANFIDGEFNLKSIFTMPKNVDYIKMILKLNMQKDDIVLDFFSGSATTAHAVMQLNAEDAGKRKYIMIQLPENLDENIKNAVDSEKKTLENAIKLCKDLKKEHTITTIAEERIRRAGRKIKEENPSAENLDTGFKVFKLESTNIVPWDSAKKLEAQDLIALKETIKAGRKEEDVVYEIMLKYGVFDIPVKKQSILDKTIYSVGDNFMIICLDENITMEVVGEIAKMNPNCAVFKELGFKDDNEKMNATYTLERCKVEKILCI